MQRNIISVFVISCIFISLIVYASAPSPLQLEIKLEPSLVELGPEYCVGDTFTIASKIYDVSNIVGIGFQITWNTTYLDYVDHIMKIPVETYPDGVLHEPLLVVADTVDPVAGTYDCAVSTLGGPTFSGSGTVFEITFRVKDQPMAPEADADFWIEYTLWNLADADAPRGVILPPPYNCHVIIHAYSPTGTVVRFDPATIELGPAYCVGETFTLKARIDNVEDLTDFGLEIAWNTTYFEYVSHILTVPVETYPNGILHNPVVVVWDLVDEVQGTYTSGAMTWGAPFFTGSGTAFEITLRLVHQPIEPEAITLTINFTNYCLGPGHNATCIDHAVQNCTVMVNPLWNPADVNDDLKVDIFDVLLCVNAYQATPSDPNWNPRCDIANPYELINIFDIVTIVRSYGEEYQ